MVINKNNIEIKYLNDEFMMVSLKCFRGASRYNNGTTKFGKKYNLRYIIHCASDRKIKPIGEAIH